MKKLFRKLLLKLLYVLDGPESDEPLEGIKLGAIPGEVVIFNRAKVIRMTPRLARELADKLPRFAKIAEETFHRPDSAFFDGLNAEETAK